MCSSLANTSLGDQHPSHCPRRPACSGRSRARQGPCGQRKAETTWTVAASMLDPSAGLSSNRLKDTGNGDRQPKANNLSIKISRATES